MTTLCIGMCIFGYRSEFNIDWSDLCARPAFFKQEDSIMGVSTIFQLLHGHFSFIAEWNPSTNVPIESLTLATNNKQTIFHIVV